MLVSLYLAQSLALSLALRRNATLTSYRRRRLRSRRRLPCRPWTSSSLVGDFSFNPSSNAGSSPVSRPATLEVATAPRSTPPLTTNAVPKSPETIAAMPLSNGTASTGDETISISTATRRGDRYSLEGRAGQQVEISATSEAFDTYLILQNDRGEGLAEDDDGGDGNQGTVTPEARHMYRIDHAAAHGLQLIGCNEWGCPQ